MSVYVATSKEFVDHIYGYISVHMNATVAIESMLLYQSIHNKTKLALSSDYQVNCLVLEILRKMDCQQLISFFESVQASDTKNDMGSVVAKCKVLIAILCSIDALVIHFSTTSSCKYSMGNY